MEGGNHRGAIGSAALVALYLIDAIPAIQSGTAWYLDHTSRMRLAFRGMEEVGQAQPGAIVIFKGVDNDLFQTGFQDNPYPLAGISQAFLAPGTENGIVAREDLGGIKGFVISPENALLAIESGKARVIEITSGAPRDITRSFETVLRAEFLASHRDSVDVGQPVYASRLSPNWHRIENGYRWLPKSATVQLAGPSSPDAKLYVTGYGSSAALAAGPVTLHFRADGVEVGSAAVTQTDQKFAFDFRVAGWPEVGGPVFDGSVHRSQPDLSPRRRFAGAGDDLRDVLGSLMLSSSVEDDRRQKTDRLSHVPASCATMVRDESTSAIARGSAGCPFRDDWSSAAELIRRLDKAISSDICSLEIILVDDGSVQAYDRNDFQMAFSSVRAISTLRLRRNVGHQRAIAIGLAYVKTTTNCDAVVVMDADGEDTPEGVAQLLRAYSGHSGSNAAGIFRWNAAMPWSESLVFRCFYQLYKWLHRSLTGISVRVGNFSILPSPYVKLRWP